MGYTGGDGLPSSIMPESTFVKSFLHKKPFIY